MKRILQNKTILTILAIILILFIYEFTYSYKYQFASLLSYSKGFKRGYQCGLYSERVNYSSIRPNMDLRDVSTENGGCYLILLEGEQPNILDSCYNPNSNSFNCT